MSSGQGLLAHFFGLALDEDAVGFLSLDVDLSFCTCIRVSVLYFAARPHDKDDTVADELCLVARVDHRW